jgi:hypothetical protein
VQDAGGSNVRARTTATVNSASLAGQLAGSLSGFNSAFLLNATTLQNNSQNSLLGAPSPALDWFFADIRDLIDGKRNDEVVTSNLVIGMILAK